MIAVYVSTSEIGGSMGNIDDVVRQTLRLRRDLCIVRWMGGWEMLMLMNFSRGHSLAGRVHFSWAGHNFEETTQSASKSPSTDAQSELLKLSIKISCFPSIKEGHFCR